MSKLKYSFTEFGSDVQFLPEAIWVLTTKPVMPDGTGVLIVKAIPFSQLQTMEQRLILTRMTLSLLQSPFVPFLVHRFYIIMCIIKIITTQ